MIRLTRLDGSELTINCDLVEMLEATPDTVVSLVTGRKLVVKESVEEISGLVVAYRRKVGECPFLRPHMPPTTSGVHNDDHER